MKARPILMHGRSVRNLLAGRKTHTRRIAKLNAAGRVERGGRQWHIDDPDAIKASPKGLPGDLLYVRETWATVNTEWGPGLAYKADDSFWQPEYDGEDFGAGPSFNYEKYPGEYCMWYGDLIRGEPDHRWKPSIHMPRWASRITLRLTDVRVERVQEISQADSLAEGIRPSPDFDSTPHELFKRLWNDTNGPGAWDRNDWVWVYAFDVIHENVEQVLAREAEPT